MMIGKVNQVSANLPGGQGVGGSNPLAPTINSLENTEGFGPSRNGPENQIENETARNVPDGRTESRTKSRTVLEAFPHLIETAHALRVFVRGKPEPVRNAALNIFAGFRTVLAGRGEPATYRMLGENVERLRGK